jgi:hypothetical protein
VGTPVSSTNIGNKTDRRDIAEILLTVALITITHSSILNRKIVETEAKSIP